MVAYLDSSVLLRHIIMGDPGIQHVLQCDQIISSELIQIECKRVIHRYRLEGKFKDEDVIETLTRLSNILEGVGLIRLSDGVKQRASDAFPVHVKTLDALHLASAMEFRVKRSQESILIFSYDTGLNRAAGALGFTTPFNTSTSWE